MRRIRRMPATTASSVMAGGTRFTPTGITRREGASIAPSAVMAWATTGSTSTLRPHLARSTAVVTTAWLLDDPGNDLQHLLRLVGQRWGVAPQLMASRLRFDRCRSQALRDYERGYIKEGVGAGGLAWLWEQSGRCPADLAAACDQAMAAGP